MAFGAKDARGIYQFGEDDAEATFSQLINKGMQSVSDATKYFSGTPAQRAALNPAPDGAIWQDTDTAARRWRGVGGNWVSATGHRVAAYAATAGTPVDPPELKIYTGVAGGTTNGSGILAHNFPVPFPTACVGVIYMPTSSDSPLIASGTVTKNSFATYFAGAPSTAKSVPYIAFGY